MTEEKAGLPVPRKPAELVTHIAGELAELREESRKRGNIERFRAAVAALVFAYWQAKFGHPRALLDKKRETLLINRLREAKDNASDLLWALDGALRDDWVMGRAPRSTRRYDSLELLLRDRPHLERYAELTRGFREDRPHPLAVKYLFPKEGVDAAHQPVREGRSEGGEP